MCILFNSDGNILIGVDIITITPNNLQEISFSDYTFGAVIGGRLYSNGEDIVDDYFVEAVVFEATSGIGKVAIANHSNPNTVTWYEEGDYIPEVDMGFEQFIP